MKKKHLYSALIWCIVTVIFTDVLSYYRTGNVVFLDIEYLSSNPIMLVALLLILTGMVFGFGKFLAYMDKG